MLHVVQISFFVDPGGRAPEQLLVDWHSLPDVARAAAGAGLRVSVIQASSVEGSLVRDGVAYSFIAPDRPGALLTRSARFAALLHSLAPDVLHVHGLCFPREVLGLRELAPVTPLLLQDHANGPPRFWRRALWKRAARQAHGIGFCAGAQAEPFRRRGLLAPHTEIFEVPESTTTFTAGDRTDARAATGLHGDPAVLWVGHLNHNKDPLTVLDGIADAARQLPGIMLWCCFATAPLMPAVQARIDAQPALRGRVRLMGRVPRAQVQALMRAADCFVLGSHHEGSGYSVIESLATGLPAIVTDIPSYRALLGPADRAPGILWRCDDAASLTAALVAAAAQPAGFWRARALARFQAALSPEALGRRLAEIYLRMSAAAPGARMRA
jgi:glycosyltransferase involved in cell wall biosynthesis